MTMQLILARPRGFCKGVEQAIKIVEDALSKGDGQRVYVYRAVVHNVEVTNKLRALGVIFVEDLVEVPIGSIVVFSAHGVPKKLQMLAEERNLDILYTTCPIVAQIHEKVQEYAQQKRKIILVGHKNHPEVEGITESCQCTPIHVLQDIENIDKVPWLRTEPSAYVVQTTFNVSIAEKIIKKLAEHYVDIIGTNTICYATHERQRAVQHLARNVDVVLVIGSEHSSNSSRLKEIAQSFNIPAYLVDSVEKIDREWFQEGVINKIGITAGASTPESSIQKIIEFFVNTLSISEIKELNIDSDIIN
jgi:4-hydroxy-3-methylbut-2-en-1-yl diphosphate reductase